MTKRSIFKQYGYKRVANNHYVKTGRYVESHLVLGDMYVKVIDDCDEAMFEAMYFGKVQDTVRSLMRRLHLNK